MLTVKMRVLSVTCAATVTTICNLTTHKCLLTMQVFLSIEIIYSSKTSNTTIIKCFITGNSHILLCHISEST